MYLMFCILHLFIFHGANRIDGGAPQGGLSCPSDNSPSEGTPPYGYMLDIIQWIKFADAVRNIQINELRGTVIPQGTLSCPSGNSPCAALAQNSRYV